MEKCSSLTNGSIQKLNYWEKVKDTVHIESDELVTKLLTSTLSCVSLLANNILRMCCIA